MLPFKNWGIFSFSCNSYIVFAECELKIHLTAIILFFQDKYNWVDLEKVNRKHMNDWQQILWWIYFPNHNKEK